ncbi:K_tetra-domain-containing protein [Chaetoceros tenuissimus]|uniref:K_tetra-domain-containing protein n=1 Tax=Chaetoceros tenuissimus TaxID=426638 RepID=A0AAD3CQA3_9STRA|nr:K_tetra-domain-containing protein [Chaetoceros tenuissimus]
MSSSSSTIVKLNIGGTPYEVSRSLINSFPDSMLGSVVSDKWKENSEELIFIERDGQRFRYVLDYMRDGKVNLPRGECVESLCTELDYFGIEYDLKLISSNDRLNVPESIRTFKAYLEDFETMKHTQAMSHIETLITIDIINKALEKFASCNIEFEVRYSDDSNSTENKLVYEFLRKELGYGNRKEIFERINESILDLNLKIVTHQFVRDYHSLSMNVKEASK